VEDNQHDPVRPWTHRRWKVDRGMHPRVVVVDENEHPIATTVHAAQGWHSGNPEADAALIALAPEMAEAILTFDPPEGSWSLPLWELREKLRALSTNAEEATR
jgi:hypothetical protein